MAAAFDNLTLWQRVYDYLHQAILENRLPPGTELSEVALSRELNVSRGPIREAIGRLAAEGLVTVRPRRGAEVRSLTPQELIDACQVREALEVLAVGLAAPRMSGEDLAALDKLVDLMSRHASAGAVTEFFAANVEFRQLLAKLSGNEKLRDVHRRLQGEIGRFQARTPVLPGDMENSVAGHRAILAAIRQRDVAKAAGLTSRHVRVLTERLQSDLAASAGQGEQAGEEDGDGHADGGQ